MGPLCQRKEPKTGKGIGFESLVMKRGCDTIRGPVSVRTPNYLDIVHACKCYYQLLYIRYIIVIEFKNDERGV